MNIYIIRHGQTLWNLQERKQGWADSPLTIKGVSQADIIKEILNKDISNLNDAKIIVSPLFRTQQYAELVFPNRSKTISHLVKEHGFGAWEGMTQEEVDIHFPGETQKRLDDWWNYVIPGGGESYEIISQRVMQFMKNIKSSGDTDTFIIVCHEMISKVMRGIYGNLSHDETLALTHPQDSVFKLSNNIITQLKQS